MKSDKFNENNVVINSQGSSFYLFCYHLSFNILKTFFVKFLFSNKSKEKNKAFKNLLNYRFWLSINIKPNVLKFIKFHFDSQELFPRGFDSPCPVIISNNENLLIQISTITLTWVARPLTVCIVSMNFISYYCYYIWCYCQRDKISERKTRDRLAHLAFLICMWCADGGVRIFGTLSLESVVVEPRDGQITLGELQELARGSRHEVVMRAFL